MLHLPFLGFAIARQMILFIFSSQVDYSYFPLYDPQVPGEALNKTPADWTTTRDSDVIEF